MVQKYVLICSLLCLALKSELVSAYPEEYDDGDEWSPLSNTCMRCLCKVMGCVKDEGCVDNVCGVLHLTRGYWEQAHGKPSDPDNIEEYQKCSNNVWCAARTVQRYMKQFLPPCDAKRPDRYLCENAVALHKFGLRRCDRNLTETTASKLHECLDENAWKGLGEEEE